MFEKLLFAVLILTAIWPYLKSWKTWLILGLGALAWRWAVLPLG